MSRFISALLWMALIHLAALSPCALATTPNEDAHQGYPVEWWTPVPRDQAASWEVLPQDAKAGEVVLSKRGDLGILSNFAATPFVLDGEHFASVEGFWQMLKYPESADDERLRDPSLIWPHTRNEVKELTGFDAKKAGERANQILKALGIAWVTYQGHRLQQFENTKGEFYRLVVRAEHAKLEQNPKVREILVRTGDLKLIPDHRIPLSDAPAWKYGEIWMEIRKELDQHKL